MEQTVECTSLDKDYPLSRQEVYHEIYSRRTAGHRSPDL